MGSDFKSPFQLTSVYYCLLGTACDFFQKILLSMLYLHLVPRLLKLRGVLAAGLRCINYF